MRLPEGTVAERIGVACAGVASAIHAVWLAGTNPAIPEGDAAHYRAMALEAIRGDAGQVFDLAVTLVPNPGVLSVWMGLVQRFLGAGERVAVAAWAPFHLLAAVGLWRGGYALGGRPGGAFALVSGLAAPAAIHTSRASLFDFPLYACVAFALGSMLAGKPVGAGVGVGLGLWTRLAAGPLFVVPVLTSRVRLWVPLLFALALYPWHAREVLEYSVTGGNVPAELRGLSGMGARLGLYFDGLLVVAQPPLLVGVVAALLTGGGLRTLGWAAGMVVCMLPLTVSPQARYLLPVLVPVIFTVAACRSRWVLAAVGAATLGQAAAYDLDRTAVWRADWRRTPVAAPAFPIDEMLRWLAARAGDRTPVAVHVQDWPGISFAALRYRALESELPLELIAVDESRPLTREVAMALVARRNPETARADWIVSLGEPDAVLAAPEGFSVRLYE